MKKSLIKHKQLFYSIIIGLLVLSNLLIWLWNYHPKLNVLSQKIEYGINVKVQNLVDVKGLGKIINADEIIDSTNLGKQQLKLTLKNILGKSFYEYLEITIVDSQAPIIIGVKNLNVEKSSEIDLYEGVEAIDNVDKDLVVYISGEYDLNVIGNYEITYYCEDSSGNMAIEKASLIVE